MLLLILILFTNISNSQEYYRVFYKEKDSTSFNNKGEIYLKTLDLYTKEAIERRLRISSELNIEDAIVNPDYIEQLKTYNLEYINSSRWFNYSLIKASPEVIEELKALSFIKKIDKTSTRFQATSDFNIESINYTDIILDKNNYGNANDQVEQLHIDELHKLGFNGDSIIIGFIDSGFRLNDRAFDSTKLRGQYDFLQNDEETSNSESDAVSQDLHGTCVLSVVSAYAQDTLIGMASEAQYYLAKTERVSEERSTEEDYYIFGVEWLETKGVELINSSLGYLDFDDGGTYAFKEFDGRTTLVSQAVNKAVARNIMYFNAIGNNGPKDSTLISPADADSVIAIGGLNKGESTIASFSSIGPNAKGDIRPHFVAQGAKVSLASSNPKTLFMLANGTSFASPLMMGATALVRAAYPKISRKVIFDAMVANSFNPAGDEPTNTFGYGIVNFKSVMDSLSAEYGAAIAPYNTFLNNGKMRVVLYVLSNEDCDVKIKYIENGKEVEKEMAKGESQYQYFFDLEDYLFEENIAKVNFIATDNKGRERQYSENFVNIYWGEEIIRKGVDKFQMPTFVSENKEDIRPVIYTDRLELINNLEKSEKIEINILDINGKFLFLNSVLTRHKKNVFYFEKNLDLGLYFVILKSKNRIKTYKLILN